MVYISLAIVLIAHQKCSQNGSPNQPTINTKTHPGQSSKKTSKIKRFTSRGGRVRGTGPVATPLDKPPSHGIGLIKCNSEALQRAFHNLACTGDGKRILYSCAPGSTVSTLFSTASALAAAASAASSCFCFCFCVIMFGFRRFLAISCYFILFVSFLAIS